MSPRTKRRIRRLGRWTKRHPVKACLVAFLAIGLLGSATQGFHSPSTPAPVASVVAATPPPPPMQAPHSKAAGSKSHAPRVGRMLYTTYRVVHLARRLFR